MSPEHEIAVTKELRDDLVALLSRYAGYPWLDTTTLKLGYLLGEVDRQHTEMRNEH